MRRSHLRGPGFLASLGGWIAIPVLFVAWIAWQGMARRHGLPPSPLPGSILILVATLVGNMIHEAGHILTGWSADMVLQGFRVGPIEWRRVKGGRWQHRFQALGFLSGTSVNMAPKDLKRVRGRLVMMMFGGPLASLLAGSIACLLALTGAGGVCWGFFALLGTHGVWTFVVNMLPILPDLGWSDGTQIHQIMTGGPSAEGHLARAMMAASHYTPLRPLDFDDESVERAANSVREGVEGFNLRLFQAIHHLGLGNTDRAREAWREAVNQDPAALEELSTDGMAELVFYEAVVEGDLGQARQWWQWVETRGDSTKGVDYWKGRTAYLILEGRLEEAYGAFGKAEECAKSISPNPEYDNWCIHLLREHLRASDIYRLSRALIDNSPLQSRESTKEESHVDMPGGLAKDAFELPAF